MGAPNNGPYPGMAGWPKKVVYYKFYKTWFTRWYIDKFIDGVNHGSVIHSQKKDIVIAKAVELQLLGERVVFENE